MPFPSLLKGDAPGCWPEPAELFWAVGFIHLPAYPQGKHLARNASRFGDGQSPPPPAPSPPHSLPCLHHNRPTSSPGAERLYLTSYSGIHLLLQPVVGQGLQTVPKVGKHSVDAIR